MHPVKRSSFVFNTVFILTFSITFCGRTFVSKAVARYASAPAGGFYSQLVKPGLRLVSLNTILYYGPNEVTRKEADPAGQFEWLEKTLQKAAQSLEKV